MKIINIKIHNFRGLDIECNGLDDKTLFIGQNDSGKSNICSAILKVFTLDRRRKPLISSDSTFGNNLDIEFDFKLEYPDLNTRYAIIKHTIKFKKLKLPINITTNKSNTKRPSLTLFSNKALASTPSPYFASTKKS